MTDKRLYIKNKNQKDAYSTPWSRKEAIMIRVWEVVWTIFIRWLPKPFSWWHILLLKLFKCRINGTPFIAPTARIYAPWLLEIGDKSCLATRCEIYNLGPVKIGRCVTIAQYSYICNGTHDMSTRKMPLLIGDINIADDVFVGAKAIIMPGICLRTGSVIGAGSVLTKDTEPWGIYAGNPAKFIKKRVIKSGISEANPSVDKPD